MVCSLRQRGGRLALQDRGQLPAEVDGIFDRCVVTQAPGGGEKVRRITTQKDAAFLEGLSDQGMAGHPSRHGEDFDVYGLPEGLHKQAPRIGFGQRFGGRVVGHLDVKSKFTHAVDRHDEGTQLGVDHHVHP